MSATLNYAVAQTPTRKVPERKYAGYLLFILCATLYLLPFMRLLLQGTDEGLLVSGAVRVAHGQVFARDFFEIVGPGTFYWLAIFFKLFGVTFIATRICLFVSSLGTGLLMYFLSARVCERYRTLPCILLAGTYLGFLWPTISHHVDSNFFALASVACMVVWQDGRKGGLLVAAGVLAGATTWFLQPKGVLLLLALLLWLCVERLRRFAPLSSIAMVIAGYLSAIGLVLAYFWSRHALRDLVYADFIWPVGHYEEVNIVPYGMGIFREYWAGWAGPMSGVSWRTGLSVVLITPFILVAVLPALLPVLGVSHRKNNVKPEIVLYWLCGFALWLSEFHRKDIHHLVFGSPLLIILCIYYLEQYRAKLADLALQVLAISAVCLGGFNFVLSLTAHSMATRVGSVAVFKSDPALTALEDRTTPGEEIFVYPSSPEYYFLSATMNPTRFSGLGYNYNSASEFQGVVRILDEHRVRYVLWNTAIEEYLFKFYFPSIKPARPDQRIIEPYLESHYKTVWTDHKGVLLMERKSEYQ
jgi:4-amino-4-deoxy-L-arabinose transferase-like glycosyltransferase